MSIRSRLPLLAASVVLLAGVFSQIPVAGAAASRTAPPSRHVPPLASGRRVSGTMRSRAVKLPPTVSVGSAPTGLAFDPATHTLYSSNQNGNSVSVINTAH